MASNCAASGVVQNHRSLFISYVNYRYTVTGESPWLMRFSSVKRFDLVKLHDMRTYDFFVILAVACCTRFFFYFLFLCIKLRVMHTRSFLDPFMSRLIQITRSIFYANS